MNAFHVLLLCGVVFSAASEFETEDDEYVGNPDDDEIVERPCQIYDIHCIRKFFASHAKCTIAKGPIPDPLPRTQVSIYLTRPNITAIQTNLMYRGLNNARIEEFYINKKTNNLVIAIEFRNFGLSSPTAYFNFHRRAREPIVAVAETFILYSSVTITAVIPNIEDLQLDQAEVTAFAEDTFPPFVIGPGVANNPEPQVLASLAEFASNVPADVQEVFLSEAPFYAPTYIQYNLCDFGLKMV